MSPFDPEYTFTPIPVTTNMKCYYCPIELQPHKDEWAIHVRVPSRNAVIFHPACLELFGWTILNYVKDTAGTMVPERTSN